MSDPIVNKAAQQIAEQAAQAEVPAQQVDMESLQVDAADQARFEQALHQPQDVAAQSVHGPAAAGPGEAKPTLGDAILDGIQHIKSNHDAHMSRIQEQLLDTGGQEMTVQDAMKLQFEVMQMNIEQDLTTKVADKTSQGVQTLFRNQ